MHVSRARALALAGLSLTVLAGPAAAATPFKPYAYPTAGSPYQIKALLSVGDRFPETSDPSRQYQMVGIPDGLGAHRNANGTTTLFMNHELTSATLSTPLLGAPQNRGAFVSKYRLDRDGDPISGQRAYDRAYEENTYVGPAAQTDNTTRAFSRFCSGFLADSSVGFDRPIYLTGEEDSSPAATFDGKGGQTVAIFNNQVHALPRLGHFPKENTLVAPRSGNRTIAMVMEDGPSTPDSQLWMYVGKKVHRKGAGVLRRNGLDNGELYVFRSRQARSEVDFQTGSIRGEWVRIPSAGRLTADQLEAAADAVGALGFVRIEDGAWSKTDQRQFYFDTTGSDYRAPGATSEANRLGRIYQLTVNPGNPLKDATLTVRVNADRVIAAGGDTAISPDNMDTNNRYLMVQEDGTSESRPVMASKGRDGSIWRFDLRTWQAQRVAQLNPPGRDGVPVGPGVWETSGIIDASSSFGRNSWLFDVQAHSPTTEPVPGTAEDGQLLLMWPAVR